MTNYSSVAIITARGGSKRIPRKNIRAFLGRPIIAYSIEAAQESRIFDEVMVSTDDSEIAAISMALGAAVPFVRSKQNSDDHATTAQVLIEVLNEYRRVGTNFELYCCIYPTAPFVTGAKLRTAKDALERHQADSAVPVVAFGYPIQRALKVVNNRVSMIQPQFSSTRSQDLEAAYHDCGQYYFGRCDILIRTGQIWSDNTVPLLTPGMEVQDIDCEEDWALAEMKYQRLAEFGGKKG